MTGCVKTGIVGSDAVVSGPTAARIFNEACASSAPTFSGFLGHATDGTYLRDADTDLYKHQKFDLSLQLSEGRTTEVCTMRFRSGEEAVTLALFISGTAIGTGPLDLNTETGEATRTLAPNVEFRFQPASTESGLHIAQIEVGVR
ncbi:MAG: hypothetical protein AAF198_06085 [Pseudomonadota bacterium]